MTLWKQLRIVFLAITLGGIIFVLMKLLLTTNTNKPKSEQSQQSHSVVLFPDEIYIVSRSQTDDSVPHDSADRR
jgi:hypothetical protein